MYEHGVLWRGHGGILRARRGHVFETWYGILERAGIFAEPAVRRFEFRFERRCLIRSSDAGGTRALLSQVPGHRSN